MQANRNQKLGFLFMLLFFCNAVTYGTAMQSKTIRNPLVLLTGASTYQGLTSNLPGVEKDMTYLYHLFYTFFHYDVRTTHSLDKKAPPELTSALLNQFLMQNNPKKKKHDFDALIFVFSGHGNRNTLLCSDNKSIDELSITSYFDQSFLGKPKIFFKFACNGGSSPKVLIQDDDDEPIAKNGTNADAGKIRVYASTPGRVSYDRRQGCLPIRILSKVWQAQYNAKKELRDLINEVIGEVAEQNERECMSIAIDGRHIKTFFAKGSFCSPGLNLQGSCMHPGCILYEKLLWINRGFKGDVVDIYNYDAQGYSIGHERHKCKCYGCKHYVKNVWHIKLAQCKYVVIKTISLNKGYDEFREGTANSLYRSIDIRQESKNSSYLEIRTANLRPKNNNHGIFQSLI